MVRRRPNDKERCPSWQVWGRDGERGKLNGTSAQAALLLLLPNQSVAPPGWRLINRFDRRPENRKHRQTDAKILSRALQQSAVKNSDFTRD